MIWNLCTIAKMIVITYQSLQYLSGSCRRIESLHHDEDEATGRTFRPPLTEVAVGPAVCEYIFIVTVVMQSTSHTLWRYEYATLHPYLSFSS